MSLLLQNLSGCSDQARAPASEGDRFPLQAIAALYAVDATRPNLDNKILLINFWATWCAPCREEMPYLQRLSEQLDPNRFAVIGISVDDDVNLVREFLLQYEIHFPNFVDTGKELASGQLALGTYPQTFIVSPQGIIDRRISEAISWDRETFEQETGSARVSRSAESQKKSNE